MPHMTTKQAEAEVLKLLKQVRESKRAQQIRWMVAYKYAEDEREMESLKDYAWSFYNGRRMKSIKRMTDEQLAEFICYSLHAIDDQDDSKSMVDAFKAEWKAWLADLVKEHEQESTNEEEE